MVTPIADPPLKNCAVYVPAGSFVGRLPPLRTARGVGRAVLTPEMPAALAGNVAASAVLAESALLSSSAMCRASGSRQERTTHSAAWAGVRRVGRGFGLPGSDKAGRVGCLVFPTTGVRESHLDGEREESLHTGADLDWLERAAVDFEGFVDRLAAPTCRWGVPVTQLWYVDGSNVASAASDPDACNVMRGTQQTRHLRPRR